jgi:hypothetical protein
LSVLISSPTTTSTPSAAWRRAKSRARTAPAMSSWSVIATTSSRPAAARTMASGVCPPSL